MNAQKEILQFWKIKSITNRDGSPKDNKKEMYDKWISKDTYVYGLRPVYIGTKYVLRWDYFHLYSYGMDEINNSGTSFIDKIENTDNGFIAYTKNSIYEFERVDITLDDLFDLMYERGNYEFI